jgi:hypothetical protein
VPVLSTRSAPALRTGQAEEFWIRITGSRTTLDRGSVPGQAGQSACTASRSATASPCRHAAGVSYASTKAVPTTVMRA